MNWSYIIQYLLVTHTSSKLFNINICCSNIKGICNFSLWKLWAIFCERLFNYIYKILQKSCVVNLLSDIILCFSSIQFRASAYSAMLESTIEPEYISLITGPIPFREVQKNAFLEQKLLKLGKSNAFILPNLLQCQLVQV